jgi:hypothetical protein
MRIVIKKEIEVDRDLLESIFVTALEGGSNYWYYLTDKQVRLVRGVVSRESEPCLSVAILDAILNHGMKIEINDAENPEDVLGTISLESIEKSLQDLANSEHYHALQNELDETGDANTSDIIFQYLTMGDVVFG